ncbi:anaphase-promoting complex subunit 4 [Culicoides brevitarsis]|uniref:anaphase-promoting complex subunit 4 n=1 Tax=Culicoides brevitarsis TaxID=469753 RepID=UPI00307C0EAF
MSVSGIRSEIKQISSRNVSYQIDLMEWSKKMDLIAISTKGDIIIHRFKWQKVWTFPAPSDNLVPRTIAWRNDEKLIAVGYNNGLVVLLDIENKEEIYSFHLNCDITCMIWTNCRKPIINSDNKQNQSCQDHSSFLPKYPSLSLLSSTTKKTDYNTLKFYSKDTMNILVTALTNASVNLSIFGMITCANLDLLKFFPHEESIEIQDLLMSDSLKQLFVVVKMRHTSHVLIFENDMLFKYSVSLLKIATQHGLIKNNLCYIHDTIQVITEAWETILLEMDNKLIKFADSQSTGSLSADFLELLMFGYPPTTALYTFLTKDLTEKGLKKLANSIELSYSTIQKLVIKPLTTSVMNVLYHLSTLKGMNKTKYFYAILLNENVDNAVSSAGSLLIKTNELQQTIETSMRDYKIFFRWLYAVIVRLMDESVPDDIAAVRQQEINYLAEFLKQLDGINEKIDNEDVLRRKFNLERVGQYLEDKNLVFPIADDCPKSWSFLLKTNDCLKNCPFMFPHDKELSLVQQFKKLSEKIEAAFNHLQIGISKNFELCYHIESPVTDILHTNFEISSTSIYIDTENVVLFVVLDSKKELTFFEIDRSFCVKSVKVTLQGSFLFQHIKFYNENTISILLTDNNPSEKTTQFLQFPVIKLRETALIYSNGDAMRIVNLFEIVDESMMKQIDGIYGIKIAVSGPRKVSSILSDTKKSIKIFEMEIDEDEEDLLETSSHNASTEVFQNI